MATVAVIADLSGDGEQPRGEVPEPRAVDLDDLDARIAELAPVARLDLPFCSEVSFASFGDFLPDALLHRVPALRGLLDARESVDDADAVAGLVREAGAEPGLVESAGPVERDAASGREDGPPREEAGGDAALLDDLLAGAAARPAAQPGLENDPEFARVLQQIADASVDRVDRALRERWQAAIEAELARRLRSILRHPRFRALESIWFHVRELVRAAERGEGVRITLTDLSRRTLVASPSPEDVMAQALHPTASSRPGGEAAQLALLDLCFGPGDDDLALLEPVARAAERTSVPVLADARESLWSDPTARSERWLALRQTDGAQWIGLCCPRALLRVPYGPNTWALETFDFDELADVGNTGETDAFAWSGSAPLLALAATRALAGEGSLRALPRFAHLESMPFTHVRASGEPEPRGPTEHLLTRPDIERLVGDGLIPLVGIQGTDAAQLVAFPAVAGTPLFDLDRW